MASKSRDLIVPSAIRSRRAFPRGTLPSSRLWRAPAATTSTTAPAKGKRGEALLTTLEAYFAAAGNAVSAAAALGVHDRTVANRLRAVEDLLGPGAVTARRAELETALRLQRLLAPER
jgi:DNA-binding PucR family transcriptional regulator